MSIILKLPFDVLKYTINNYIDHDSLLDLNIAMRSFNKQLWLDSICRIYPLIFNPFKLIIQSYRIKKLHSNFYDYNIANLNNETFWFTVTSTLNSIVISSLYVSFNCDAYRTESYIINCNTLVYNYVTNSNVIIYVSRSSDNVYQFMCYEIMTKKYYEIYEYKTTNINRIKIFLLSDIGNIVTITIDDNGLKDLLINLNTYHVMEIEHKQNVHYFECFDTILASTKVEEYFNDIIIVNLFSNNVDVKTEDKNLYSIIVHKCYNHYVYNYKINNTVYVCKIETISTCEFLVISKYGEKIIVEKLVNIYPSNKFVNLTVINGSYFSLRSDNGSKIEIVIYSCETLRPVRKFTLPYTAIHHMTIHENNLILITKTKFFKYEFKK